jgi:selenocysteine lyase/cysteine desulfurase
VDLDKEINTIRRESFPELDNKLYFSTCRQGIPPKQASELARQFIDEVRGRNDLPLFNKFEKALKKEVAFLLGASENEITFIRSTSEGLSLIVRAIRWENGDNVIINNLEFMANVIPWLALKKIGVKVKVIHHSEGRIYPSQIEDAIDNKTRAITIAAVQECNGFRCDLEEIGKICKTKGLYLIVDGIQQLGVMDLNVKRANIDVLVAGGHKWLLSPYGAGVLYINRNILEDLDPVIIGWKNVEQKDFYAELSLPNWTPIREYKIRN